MSGTEPHSVHIKRLMSTLPPPRMTAVIINGPYCGSDKLILSEDVNVMFYILGICLCVTCDSITILEFQIPQLKSLLLNNGH